MKNFIKTHMVTIKKWGAIAAVIYLIKALIYIGLIVWGASIFTQY